MWFFYSFVTFNFLTKKKIREKSAHLFSERKRRELLFTLLTVTKERNKNRFFNICFFIFFFWQPLERGVLIFFQREKRREFLFIFLREKKKRNKNNQKGVLDYSLHKRGFEVILAPTHYSSNSQRIDKKIMA